MPSREAAALARLEERTRWGIAIGLVLLAVGTGVLATLSSGTARLFGGVGAFCGFGFVWGFVLYLRLLGQARESLKVPPLDLLLDRKFQLSKTGSAFPATLWTIDSQQRPLACFSSTQWSVPLVMTAGRVHARVYGAPLRGAVVVVSTADGVLAGRITFSRYGRDGLPGRPARGLGWLFKPLRLPFSRR
jgi:hypothetical protein